MVDLADQKQGRARSKTDILSARGSRRASLWTHPLRRPRPTHEQRPSFDVWYAPPTHTTPRTYHKKHVGYEGWLHASGSEILTIHTCLLDPHRKMSWTHPPRNGILSNDEAFRQRVWKGDLMDLARPWLLVGCGGRVGVYGGVDFHSCWAATTTATSSSSSTPRASRNIIQHQDPASEHQPQNKASPVQELLQNNIISKTAKDNATNFHNINNIDMSLHIINNKDASFYIINNNEIDFLHCLPSLRNNDTRTIKIDIPKSFADFSS